MKTWTAIESKHYRHPSGKTASLYGAHPHHGAGNGGWEIVTAGWSVANKDGTVGCGRIPWKTEAEAEAFCNKWNK